MSLNWFKLFVEISFPFAWDWLSGGHVTQFWPVISKERSTRRFWQRFFSFIKERFLPFGKLSYGDGIFGVGAAIL